MADKRWRFVVEYENRDEWGLGVVPGKQAEEQAESPQNHEVVMVLRIVADELERNFPDCRRAPAIVFPPREEAVDDRN